MNAHAKWLRMAAEEIAKAGHNGWGNTCLQAADEIDRLQSLVEAEADDPTGAARRLSWWEHELSGKNAECGCPLTNGGWALHDSKTCLSLRPAVSENPRNDDV